MRFETAADALGAPRVISKAVSNCSISPFVTDEVCVECGD